MTSENKMKLKYMKIEYIITDSVLQLVKIINHFGDVLVVANLA